MEATDRRASRRRASDSVSAVLAEAALHQMQSQMQDVIEERMLLHKQKAEAEQRISKQRSVRQQNAKDKEEMMQQGRALVRLTHGSTSGATCDLRSPFVFLLLCPCASL